MSSGLYSGVSGLALGIGLYRNVSGLWGGASGLIDGFGGSDPYSGASLYLNFLNPVLDPRIDFSRGTNATLIDSTGKLTYAPNNLATWSEDFSNAIWTSSSAGVTVATDATVAPNGTTTADKLAETATTDTHRRGFAISSLARAPYVFSVYAKAAERTILRGWSFSGGDTNEQTFNLANGTCTGSLNPIITPVGNGWYRCSFTVPAANAGSVVFGPSDGTGGTNAYPGVAGFGIFVWGAQLEAVTYQTTPGPYNATTASAYYGPRFDYDPVTLAPRGLLIEEARTNSITYSDDWSNAAWSKGGLTVSSNVTASPDGTANADKLAEDTSVGTHGVTSALITKAAVATTYTYSIYVKAAERTAVQLRIADAAASANRVICDANLATQTVTTSVGGTFTNASATITNAANGWFRVTLTGTTSTETGLFCIAFLANPAGTISYTGVTGSGAFIYGAQLEAGSFATSYIPTVASTVTRNADVATMTGTNFSTWYNQSEGVFVADADSVVGNLAAINIPASASDGTFSNFIRTYIFSGVRGASVTTGGVTQADLSVAGHTSNAISKWAFAYKANDFALSVNGAAALTDASGTVPVVDRLGIGSLNNANQLNGHVRTIAYFNTRLPNAQLQTLTAPSLATTLSLDFTTGSYNVGF